VLRVLTYNIRSLRDDRRAVAELIRSTTPDVVLIQEAPRFLRSRSKIAALARDSGMTVVTGGRPAAAMLVLARPELTRIATRNVLLPKTVGLHQRGIAMAVLAKDGLRFGVASIHLGLRAAERSRHAELVNAACAELADDLPWVIGGDLNEEPGEPAWTILADGRRDAWADAADQLGGPTSPSRSPRRRIDGVFCDQAFEVLMGGTPRGVDALVSKASDHRPVLALLDSNGARRP
jgi:endonuclease/exonuclease/phosphatase family metal-dependent hydrolase